MTLAINSSPRRISLVGMDDTRPSDSGATIAGQMNRRNMKAPTAVYFAFGKRCDTVSDIYVAKQVNGAHKVQANATHNTANSPE